MIRSPHHTDFVEVDTPIPGPRDVLIRVHRAGICGTDLHILHGTYQATYPLIPGHELSGVVEAVGGDVTGFSAGDRVTADPNLACNRFENCKRNEPNQCLNWEGVGVTRPGGFAEYVVFPESNVHPIADLPFDRAAFIEPLACVVWGIHMIEPRIGDRALVFGAGPMGCLVMQALNRAGVAEIAVVDRVRGRLDIAEELGATHTLTPEELEREGATIAPHGFDVVVDATGLAAVVEQCFGHARARGKVWLFGVCPPDARASFSPYEVFRKDLRIYGSYAVNRTFSESVSLIANGAVRVDPLLSHTLPLERFDDGMHIAEHDSDRMKVQFEIPG